jgi:hypothetical protein
MKNHTSLIIIFIFSISFLSCTRAFISDEEEIVNPINKIIKYNSDVKQIMTNNCITCHGGPSPSAGLDLSNFSNVKNAALSRDLLERMNDATAPMPQNGLLLLSTRKIMDKWKTDGYLEN